MTVEQPKVQKVHTFPLTLDLQYFAGEDHPFADTNSAPEPHPFAAEPSESNFAQFTEQPNPLLGGEYAPETPQVQPEGQGDTVDHEQNPSEQPQDQEEYLDFSGRKVKAYGDDVKGLHQDYTELNRTYQTTNQELQQARQLLEQYQQVIGQQQPPAIEQAQPSHTPGVDPGRMQQLNEEYMERMYENKFEADQWWSQQPEVQAMEQQRIEALVQSRVNEVLGPVQQEREIQQQVQEVKSRFSDFDTYADKMQEIVQQHPHLAEVPNAIESLYYMAKGQSAASAPQPDQLLQDPSFQEKIIQNEQIRNMVLQNYQQAKTQSAPPNVMNRGASQVPSSLGEQQPRSLAEASQAFMRWAGQR